jgi:hypothetical protein
MNRPKQVTVIAWLLIILGALGIVSLVAIFCLPEAKVILIRSVRENYDLPRDLVFPVQYAGLALYVLSGMLMLNGVNFGRWLYVITVIAFFVLFQILLVDRTGHPVSREPYVFDLVVPVIITFLLFRPSSNRFFRPEGNARSETDSEFSDMSWTEEVRFREVD